MEKNNCIAGIVLFSAILASCPSGQLFPGVADWSSLVADLIDWALDDADRPDSVSAISKLVGSLVNKLHDGISCFLTSHS